MKCIQTFGGPHPYPVWAGGPTMLRGSMIILVSPSSQSSGPRIRCLMRINHLWHGHKLRRGSRSNDCDLTAVANTPAMPSQSSLKSKAWCVDSRPTTHHSIMALQNPSIVDSWSASVHSLFSLGSQSPCGPKQHDLLFG